MSAYRDHIRAVAEPVRRPMDNLLIRAVVMTTIAVVTFVLVALALR